MNEFHGTYRPLDSRQLRAFAALARTGSFTRTGKEIHLSQSAVSHSVKALESDIGCRLFDRVGKRVHLTPAGEHFLHHAERVLEEMAAARTAMEQLGRWGKGRLRIGASPTACQYILPVVFRAFKRDFPETSIAVELCDAAKARVLLQEKRIDLAVVLQAEGMEQFEFEPLFQDELAFLAAPDHPWAKAGRVIREEVEQQSFVLYSKSSQTFRLIDEYFRKDGIVLNTVAELGSMEAIKEFAKLGFGITILAHWVARRELSEGSLVSLPLGRRKLKRTWGILRLHDKRLNLAEETFSRVCRNRCKEMISACEPDSGPHEPDSVPAQQTIRGSDAMISL